MSADLKLTIAASLDMATKMDVCALSGWHEQLVGSEKFVELQQWMRNTCEHKALPVVWLLGRQYYHIFWTPEGLTQIELYVLSSCRRGTTVLMTSSSNSDSNTLILGIFKGEFDVLLVLWLYYDSWIHVMVDAMRA